MRTRREFLQLGCAALIGMSTKSDRKIAGGWVNDNFAAGHAIRDRVAHSTADAHGTHSLS